MARTYPEGEDLPSNICPSCRTRKISRSGMGTCGRQNCLLIENHKAIYGEGNPAQDNRDPVKSMGRMRIKVDGKGSAKRVQRSTTVRGTHCYVLQDGTTVPISRCKEV